MDNIKHYFKQHKKSSIIIGSILGVFLIGFLIFKFAYPAYETHKASSYRAKITKTKGRGTTQMPKGKFKYDPSTKTPDLATLQRLAKEGAKNSKLRGFIFIPSAGIKELPVYEGVNPYTLSLGAGTAKPWQVAGKGNYAIEAHNYIKLRGGQDWFLSRLQTEVAPAGNYSAKYIRPKDGNLIELTDGQNLAKYKIISRKIIGINAPYATTMLTDRYVNAFPNKKPLITLATCFEQNGITYPNQRIVVTGELTSIKPIKK